MTHYKVVDVAERPYLFVTRRVPGVPNAARRAMVEAFGEVTDFMQKNGIVMAGPPLAVYYTYGHDEVEFRAGLLVSAQDAKKAAGGIAAAVTPAGRVLTFTHVGSYRQLGASYDALLKHLEDEGLSLGAPSWEVYVDDPEKVPEDRLRTEIFVTLG